MHSDEHDPSWLGSWKQKQLYHYYSFEFASIATVGTRTTKQTVK